MKTKLTLLPLAALLAPAAFASPFAVRLLPTGPDTAFAGEGRIMSPIAADFLGNGRRQWYQGGDTISRFPESGLIRLPAITLPGTPAATPVPLTAAAADLDRDGDTDLVRILEWNGNAFKYTLQVYVNNGSGTFTLGYRTDWNLSWPYDEGRHFLSVVPGDFDKNGTPDLAILETFQKPDRGTNPDHYDGRLYIRPNAGNATFDAITALQVNGLTGQCRISAADYDRDGDMDIHCSDYTTYGLDTGGGAGAEKKRSLLFSNGGNGVFTTGDNFPNKMPGEMVDINNDGWADLADGLTKSLNNGDGTFGPVTAQSSAWQYGYALASLDRNPRRVVVGIDGPQLTAGGNALATLPTIIDKMGAADSDGDGDTDFLVSLLNGRFALVENREFHTTAGAVVTGTVSLSGITSLTSADFDLDGRDDLVAVAHDAERLWFINSLADGSAAAPVFKPTGGQAPQCAVAADFDTDGRPDVAYARPGSGEVRLARNTGSSPFLWADTAIATGLPGVSLLAEGNVGVFSGRPDLFAVVGGTGQLRALNQTSAGWSGSNILAAQTPAPLALAVGQHSYGIGDEVAWFGGGSGQRVLGCAQLTFGWGALGGGAESEPGTAPPPRKLVWADISGDASEEVVYVSAGGGLAAWNPSANTFTTFFSGPAGIRDIAAADWDGDGRTDIVAATARGLTLFHRPRASQHWLRSDLSIPESGLGYDQVAVLNLNRDGFPDAAAYTGGNRIHFLLNNRLNLRADLAAQPTEKNLIQGRNDDALILPLSTNGRPVVDGGPADPVVVATQCDLLFQRAVSGPNGTWTPGPAMSAAALSGVVESVVLEANGTVIASRPRSSVSDSGVLRLERLSNGPTVNIAPGALVEHSLRLDTAINPPPQAATRFFLTVKGVAGHATDGGALPPGFGGSTLLLNNRPVLFTIRPALTPLQEWREANFGTVDAVGDAANEADPDDDGVPNLVEYVMKRDPKSPGGEAPLEMRLPSGGSLATLDLRLAGDYDEAVRVSIQSSTDLETWTMLNTRTGTGAWAKEPVGAVPADAGRTQFTFLAEAGASPTGKQFFRMVAEELE